MICSIDFDLEEKRTLCFHKRFPFLFAMMFAMLIVLNTNQNNNNNNNRKKRKEMSCNL